MRSISASSEEVDGEENVHRGVSDLPETRASGGRSLVLLGRESGSRAHSLTREQQLEVQLIRSTPAGPGLPAAPLRPSHCQCNAPSEAGADGRNTKAASSLTPWNTPRSALLWLWKQAAGSGGVHTVGGTPECHEVWTDIQAAVRMY